ncbi:MAG: hypothetical protein JSS27_11595 [Planctomycetes bacterium]|nr:hypothetical protein [Planctomycetota bacterium]
MGRFSIQRRVFTSHLLAGLAGALALPWPLNAARAEPPAVSPDAVFSDSRPHVPSMAMVPPASDYPAFLPYPAAPAANSPLYVPSPPTAAYPAEDAPAVYYNLFGQQKTEPPILRQLAYRKSIMPPGTELFGIVDINLEATFAPRRPILGTTLYATPFFNFHLFESPQVITTPGTVYDAGVELRQMYQFIPRWTFDMAVAPSVYTDFDTSQRSVYRVVGRGVAIYDVSPTLQLALGATYLGRNDIKALPIFGAIWRPDSATEIEAIYPRPRVSRRFTPPTIVEKFSHHPLAPLFGFSPIQQYWLYVSGELGGNTWAVRQNGLDDQLTYYDLRVMLGIEQRAAHGPRGRIEIGYVFNREVSYASGADALLHDTFIMRGELAH